MSEVVEEPPSQDDGGGSNRRKRDNWTADQAYTIAEVYLEHRIVEQSLGNRKEDGNFWRSVQRLVNQRLQGSIIHRDHQAVKGKWRTMSKHVQESP